MSEKIPFGNIKIEMSPEDVKVFLNNKVLEDKQAAALIRKLLEHEGDEQGTALSSGIAGISAGLLDSGYAIEDICNAIQGELENHLIAAGVPSSVSLVPTSQNSTGAKGKLLHFPS